MSSGLEPRPATPLAVGLLTESVLADRYVEELARWIRGEPALRLALIVAPGARASPNPVRRAVASVEKRLLHRHARHRDHYGVRDLREGMDGSLPIAPACDAERVRALGLDVVVSLGVPLPRDVVRAARLGALAVEHDGFWACYRASDQTRFAIRRLGHTDGSDEMLLGGAFRTRYFGALNEAHVRRKALAHLKRVLRATAASGELPLPRGNAAPAAGAEREPDLPQCVAYACKLATRLALKAPYRTRFFGERFGVSVIPGPWNESLAWQRAAGRLPRGRFWADPFIHARGGRTFCFVEDLDRRTQRGHITVLEVNGTELVELGVALREPFHLSFPFLFEHGGELYMCPESSAAREIRLYRCLEFPLRWRFEKSLMRGVSAADTMLFERDGRCWMLTNIDESESGDHCSELYLFSAASPLATDWRPHPQNPVLIDSMGGRNGGLIVEGDRLFRIGQCQSFARYGESLRVYEIRELSTERYAEELVREIGPDFRKGALGTHHLSTDGTTTLVDHAAAAF